MSDALGRVRAVLVADLRVRLRKRSSFVIFLATCFMAYGWVPASTANHTLMAVEGHRVLLDSPAMAVATGLICSLLMALVGFYLVKGSIENDVASRCGLIVASTPTSSLEYLVGRFLGNGLFLSVLGAGFLVSSMGMQLLRGEAPLDPVPFLYLYLLFLPPAIVFPSVMALVFDSNRWLSGRGGEVLYFFLWGLLIAVGIGWKIGEVDAGAYVDMTGVSLLEMALEDLAGMEQLSIGAATYDSAKEVMIFEPVRPRADWIVPRATSTVAALPFLLLAAVFFHRFDPTHSRASKRGRRDGWTSSLARRVRGSVSTVVSQLPRSESHGGRSLLGAAGTEARLTLQLQPLAAAGLILTMPMSLLTPAGLLMGGVLPAIHLMLAVLLAEGACRERRAGTTGLVWAAPRLKEAYVWWKLTAALLLAIAFTALPALRLGLADPGIALSVLSGGIFVAASATAIGVLSGTPRAFLLLFLCFWYVVLNDGGASPVLDFAGFYGSAGPGTRGLYLGLGVVSLAVAESFYRIRLARS